MGIGHATNHNLLRRQQSFFKADRLARFSYGGTHRNKRSGRKNRPLSHKDPIHLVFKVDRFRLRHKTLRFHRTYQIIQKVIRKYSKHFDVRIEQVSIQYDHVHILARSNQKIKFLNFFRVLSGQVAQILEKEGLLCPKMVKSFDFRTAKNVVTDTPQMVTVRGTGLWKLRPFSRIVFGWKAYVIVKNYIQLNEKEALGQIKYSKYRLRGLSASDWNILWT